MERPGPIAALLRLTALLPLPVVHGLGTGIGWLLWLFPNNQRRIAAINLELCLPDLRSAARAKLLRQNLVETSKTMLELGPLWLRDGKRVLGLIRSVQGEEVLLAALAQGHGVILITPHLGAWELTSLYLSSRYPITILYRPSRLDIDTLVRASRERLGARAVPTNQAGVRALFQALRSGQMVGILPDQDPGRDGGMFVPFFKRPANTMVLLSRLAIKSGSPVLSVYAERLSWGRGYCLHFQSLPAAVNQEPTEDSVTLINRAVEEVVRRLPSQYLWVYKRFKRPPPGMPTIY